MLFKTHKKTHFAYFLIKILCFFFNCGEVGEQTFLTNQKVVLRPVQKNWEFRNRAVVFCIPNNCKD